MPRILHTSDMHIGKVFEQFGEFGSRLRGQIRETCRRVFELAGTERVDAVLLAGDIFDSGTIAQIDFRFFMEAVSSVRPIPVLFLPGTWTHDSLHQKHIYRSRYFLQDKPENLAVFTKEELETFRAASGQVAIHGRAVLPDSGNPLEGLRLDPRAPYNMGILHTGAALPHIPEDKTGCALKREYVDGSGLSYLAMGDFHVFRRFFEDAQTIVQYSGSPETLQFKDGEGSGFVALVTLSGGSPHVEKRRVGRYKWQELDVQWEALGSIEALKKYLTGLADLQTVLRVVLRGITSGTLVLDWERFREDLRPKFGYLDFNTAQLKEELSLKELNRSYRENTVERAFVMLIEEAIQNASNGVEAERLRQVLRRGHALFQGYEEALS